jgi:putative lipoprotein
MRFGIQYALAALIWVGAASTQAQGVDGAATRGDQAGQGRVTGTLIYRERLMLPPGTVAEVSLLDVSRADAPARTLAQQIIVDPPPPPIPFVLEYDPTEIDERMSYAVRAEIRQQDQLLFNTDTMYPVITRGAGNSAALLLKRVGG